MYPIPARCVHDNGNEFLGPEFNQMLLRNNIHPVPTTVKNPQSNAIVEHLHQTLNTIISISIRQHPPSSFEDVSSMIHRQCATVQFGIQATSHSQHKFSPGEMAFGRNMLHPFSAQVKWNNILNKKQELVEKANVKENSGRRFHDYQINDQVHIPNRTYIRGKLEPTTLPEGPWKIVQVHINGTVSIQRRKYIERMNIRRTRPFFPGFKSP